MPKQIEVTLGTDGSVSVDAQGFKGKGCDEAAKFIEDSLGGKKNYKRKSEWYAGEGVGQKASLGR